MTLARWLAMPKFAVLFVSRIAFAAILASFGANCDSRESVAGRTQINLNAGWKFSVDKSSKLDASPVEYNDSMWKGVNLPHDYVVEQQFQTGLDAQHGSLPTPIGWYRKRIRVAIQKGREFWLDFEGIFRNSQIFLNGQLAAEQPSGYLPIHINATRFVSPDGFLCIAVRVDPSKAEGWWYEGGGIYRPVRLTSVSELHVEPDGVRVQPIVVGDASNPSQAKLKIEAQVSNRSQMPANCQARFRVFGPGDRTVWQGSQTLVPVNPASEMQSISIEGEIAKPNLWSIEHPNLYRLETELVSGGQVIDHVTTRFGVRSIRFDANLGFFLNGKNVKIKGVCNHQDFGCLGIAIPENLDRWRVRKMMDMGANAWRMSHNPPSRELLDACDEMGMLVLDENRHLGDTYDVKTYWDKTPAEKLEDLKAMIVRDRNHPSIIAWSLCNEEPLQGKDSGAVILAKMVEIAHQLDPGRPVTAAMNGGWGHGFSEVVDVQGCNYFNESYEVFHRAFPAKPMLFTETSSAVSDRGVYDNDWKQAHVGSYTQPVQDQWPDWMTRSEESWKPVAETPFLAGAFVWTGFDYRGEPSPFGWPNVSSHFGILDLCGFPKDVYYYYRAWWKNAPTVHITPHWNWPDSVGKEIKVLVFSNSAVVELIQDGKSLGRKSMPRNGHVEWPVTYRPGSLTAQAIDSRGIVVATERVRTATAQSRIRLRTDMGQICANGEDVAVIEAEVVDANGCPVPNASNRITFAIEGGGAILVGTGNGDPNDHVPSASPSRVVFSGKAAAVIRSAGTRGTVRVTATSPGLAPATLSVQLD